MLSRTSIYLALIGTLALGLTACSTIRVPVGAADPTNPKCAEIMVSLPNEVMGQKRVETDSQSTAAWGEGTDAVLFRCGVTPPPPTTELCTTIESSNGIQIDWIVQEMESNGTVLFTTYGREPAIDISVPRSIAPDQPSAASIELSGLISQIEQTGGRCLAFYDS